MAWDILSGGISKNLTKIYKGKKRPRYHQLQILMISA